MDIIQPYIKEVLSGNGKHGINEIKAVERYLKDRKDKRFVFREDIVEKRLKAAKLMRHTKDRFYGLPFTLQGWQIFIIVNLFGFYLKKNGRRRFRKFYLDVSRKNGKTEFAVLLANLYYIFDNVPSAECYFAATKRDQAAIGFDTCKVMVSQLRQDSNLIKGMVNVMANAITIPRTGGTMKAVSSDAKTLDGLNPLIVIIDEYHAHPNNSVLKVMETGQGARENPILMITTTAGINKNSPCKKYRDMCGRILRNKIKDETLFAMIFSMDEDDDWEDQKNWYKCNPNVGVSIDMEWLASQYKSAKNEGEQSINEFKTKNLNVWTSVSISFINDRTWMMNSSDVDVNDEVMCWGGLDLSSVRDLTVYLLLFENGSIIPYFFCPMSKIEDRSNADGVDYAQWHKDGLIEAIPGNAIDLRVIKRRVLEINSEYNVVANCYDPWKADQIAQELIEEGISMIPMTQSYKNFTQPVYEIEKNAHNAAYKHGGHPILRWNNENVMLKINSNANAMFDKSNTKTAGAKIDGMVALAMAEFGRMMKIVDKKYKGVGVVKL